jgi:hypothetical protein
VQTPEKEKAADRSHGKEVLPRALISIRTTTTALATRYLKVPPQSMVAREVGSWGGGAKGEEEDSTVRMLW